MNRLFTSEFVSFGHPDKIADQISDLILDLYLAKDPESRVAVETLVTENLVVIAGEVTSKAAITREIIDDEVRKLISSIGYNSPELGFCGNTVSIEQYIHRQSPDIAMGVDSSNTKEQGAGDQGIMFGYATNETYNFIPLTLDIAKSLIYKVEEILLNSIVSKEKGYNDDHIFPKWIRPDAKSQVTIEYDENWNPVRIHTIVLSVQHDSTVDIDTVRDFLTEHVIIPVVKDAKVRYTSLENRPLDDIIIHINPTGKFVIGGPAGDTGLTGRKIIIDTYGGRAPHGGGAFSGKDPSKVDRSAAYAARHIAKNLVAAGIADEVTLQLAYCIGVAQPVSIYVNAKNPKFSQDEIVECIKILWDLTPAGIIKKFNLKRPIYGSTVNGFDGMDEIVIGKTIFSGHSWENLDMVDSIKKYFNI